ncbi:glycosyl hydrolase [Rariglobus hedericola]|uniref:Beta-mannosidase n=1 Tax=Rariglobus hedericola TaxID=2597822 RepID=A0A556QSI4_9BACT|nr:glycosyl hydrolase [Rariglobus hedericola]TSJ79579.1 beta-mannosidase [Rariglobus hedericola]
MLCHLPSFLFAVAALFLSGCAHTSEYPARAATVLGSVQIVPPDATTDRDRATGFTQPGDAIVFSVPAPRDGFYRLDLVYSADAEKRIPVTINGSMQGSRLFPKTTGFETRSFGRIRLRAGTNTVRIGTDWGYADIASIRIKRTSPPREFHLRTTPVNPNASHESRALFTTLTREFGQRTFTGQHESNPTVPSRLDYITRNTGGATPAILGLDLIYYSPSWNQPGGDGAIEAARDWALNRHGIVSLSWHWLAPLHAGPLIWDSFSTSKTPFDVSRIADESSPEYAAIIRDLDHLAEKLKPLRDARIPVLWRPLHEAEGGWFWWGARGPDATRQLYRLMFDRFTRIHHLDNLLWVWTSTDDDRSLDWYPGDNYVDILATDLYFSPGTRGDFFTVFDRLRELHGGRKPIALGECGSIPDLTADAPWLWFLTWDDLISRPELNPADFVYTIFRTPRAILLKGLQSASPAPHSR